MLESIMAAVIILFAVVGAVMLLCILLMRMMRPRAGDVYRLSVYLRPGDEDCAAHISYAAEKLRFSGDQAFCTLNAVDCGIDTQELETLKSMFAAYPFVRFISLSEEET